jgi:hypothetical protein
MEDDMGSARISANMLHRASLQEVINSRTRLAEAQQSHEPISQLRTDQHLGEVPGDAVDQCILAEVGRDGAVCQDNKGTCEL